MNFDFLEITQVYTVTRLTVEGFILILFNSADDVASQLSIALTAMAAIYIALTGYGLMSGMIQMSMREAGMKLAKVILVLVLLELIGNFGGAIYQFAWNIPESIGNFIANRINPLVGLGSFTVAGVPVFTSFDALMNGYSILATEVADATNKEHEEKNYGMLVWALAMAPMFLMTIAIMIAKVITAVLFVISPVVFGLSLIGFSNNFLMSWFKSIISTFLTVIIVFIVGTAGLSMVMTQLLALTLTSGTGTFIPIGTTGAWSIPALAPMGILSLFTVMLLSQAPQIASAIIGVAAAGNTQQATSFMQIAALQSAARTPASGVGATNVIKQGANTN